MSHELRTPLHAILGFSQMIPSYADVSSQTIEAAGYIARSGWHLLELIDEVLDLSRIETGSMRVNSEPLDLSGMVEESVRIQQVQAQRPGRDARPRREHRAWRYWVTARACGRC